MTGLDEQLKQISKWREDVTFFLLDYNTRKVIYEYNADMIRTIGSITKLISAYVLLDDKLTSEESRNEIITIDKEVSDISFSHNYSCYEQYRVNETYSAGELLNMCLIPSGCASTLALVKHFYSDENAFIGRMSEYMEKLHINASFRDCYGISPYNRCTARGIASLAAEIIDKHPEILSITSRKSVMLNRIEYRNTSSLIKDDLVPGMDGLKSGTTLVSGHCYLGTAQRDGHRVISIVMNALTKEELNAATKALLEYGLSQKL